jgi:hypothetical protein
MELRDRLLDPGKVRDGVWCEYEGARFRVRHLPNQDSTVLQYRLFEEWRAQQGAEAPDEIPPDVRADVLDRTLVATVLLGWDGVTLDGVAFEYGEDNALRMVKGDPEFRGWLILQAYTSGNFREERIEADAERLGNGSSGAQPGARASKNSKR